MREIQDLAGLINIRNFLFSSIDNMQIKLSREEIKSIQQKVQLLDKTIVENSLKLDINLFNKEFNSLVREFSITASESTEDTMNKILSTDNKKSENKLSK